MKPVSLATHAVVHRDQLGIERCGGVGRGSDVVAHELDAVAGQRVGDHVGVLALDLQRLLVAKDLEELQHTACRLAATARGR